MLQNYHGFSGFSVNDIEVAARFYRDTLGLTVDQTNMGLKLHFSGGGDAFVYQKADHQPASFTILNFEVDDIDAVLDKLVTGGVTFEKYDDPNMPQDNKGILRGRSVHMGPDIAWFKDPAGNILSILQN